MSLRSEIVRVGMRLLIKRHKYRDLTIEQHRRSAPPAERLVPDPPPYTRTLTVDAGGVGADLISTPVSDDDRHVLFLHGGGFLNGPPPPFPPRPWRHAT